MVEPKKLRRKGTWQVLLVTGTSAEGHAPGTLGTLLVVDGDSGAVRSAGPLSGLEDLEEHLLRAALEPGPGLPVLRPRSLLTEASLAAALRGASHCLAASVAVDPVLAQARQAAAELLHSLSSRAQRLPQDPGPWSQVMGIALQEHPWTLVSDGVVFTLEATGARVDQAVVTVLGQTGELRGFAIYPDLASYLAFDGVARSGASPSQAGDARCWCVHLASADDCDAQTVATARGRGLVQEGLVLQTFGYHGDTGIFALSASEELASLHALRAVLLTCRQHGESLATHACAASIPVDRGVHVEVETLPFGLAAPEDTAAEAERLRWEEPDPHGILNLSGGDPWARPRADWPVPAEVFSAFAAPLAPESWPPDQLAHQLKLLGFVWTAVVMADHQDDPGALEQVRRRFAAEPNLTGAIEELIHRKRTCYPSDDRPMFVEEAWVEDGRVRVRLR